MALDPRIALMGTPVDVQRTFANTLTNISNLDAIKQNQLNAPLQNQLLQQQVDTGQSALGQEREKQRTQSMVDFSLQVSKFLNEGDDVGALQFTESRIEQLKASGVPTADSEEFRDLLLANPVAAIDAANKGVEFGREKGLIGFQQGQAAGTREFNHLLQVAQDPNSTEIEKNAALVALGGRARKGSSAQERILESEDLTGKAINLEGGKSGAKEAAKLGEQLKTEPLITAAVETAKLEPALRKETQKANIRRMSELQSGEKSRNASVKKASQFLRALKSGDAHSGATRSTLSFIPGVFTSQAQFDERFNAFAEVAARQQLKAAGEIRPTDADVEGMKRAMFGVGRDEQTNIQLLDEFISAQQDQTDELDDLKESRKNKTLDRFGSQQPQDNRGGLPQQEQPAQQQFQEGQTATNAQGQRIIFQGGQWVVNNG